MSKRDLKNFLKNFWSEKVKVFKYTQRKKIFFLFSFFKKKTLKVNFFFNFFLYFFGTLKHFKVNNGSIIDESQNNKKFILKNKLVKLKNE